MRRSVHMRNPSCDPVQTPGEEIFPRELPVAPAHTLLFAPAPPIEALYHIAFHLMEVLGTVEPIVVIGPAPQHGIEVADDRVQRFRVIASHCRADLLPNALHGFRTGKAIAELPIAIPPSG